MARGDRCVSAVRPASARRVAELWRLPGVRRRAGRARLPAFCRRRFHAHRRHARLTSCFSRSEETAEVAETAEQIVSRVLCGLRGFFLFSEFGVKPLYEFKLDVR